MLNAIDRKAIALLAVSGAMLVSPPPADAAPFDQCNQIICLETNCTYTMAQYVCFVYCQDTVVFQCGYDRPNVHGSMAMGKQLDNALTVALTLSAVTVAGAVVRREFERSRPARPAVRSPELLDKDQWESLLSDAVVMGDTSAAVKIAVFADLECPFCARLHSTTLNEVLSLHGDSVTMAFMHFPLPTHRFADAAAAAAECAADQGRFAEFIDVVYEKQDSLGLKSWADYARSASISDSVRFATCLDRPPPARIAAGKRWAMQLGLTGTPSVVVNGWILFQPPDTGELLRIIASIKAGESPFEHIVSQ